MAPALPPKVAEVDGGRVLLAPWTDEDCAGVLQLAEDPATRAWSPSLRTVHTLAAARRWLASRAGADRLDWAVRDPATRALLGRVGLRRFDDGPPSAEVGYVVHPAHRRRGVARAAVETAAGYAFGELGLARVSLRHAVGNFASCAVAVRCGFGYEGLERAGLEHGDGVLHDVHRHARLATDPPGPAGAPPVPLAVPVLVAAGLRLRPWRDQDAASVRRGLADPQTARWNPHPPPASEDDARRRIGQLHRRAQEGHGLAWAVEAEEEVAGSVGLRAVNLVDRWASASYWVLPEARGRGIAARALGAATAYAFEALGLHRVRLQHALANTASCRVAAKAGFALEGIQRGSCLLVEGFVDEHQHARLATDPR